MNSFTFQLVLLFAYFCNFHVIVSTIINSGQPIFCDRANVSEVRIEGCQAEPCEIVKGKEVLIEVDFEFEAPAETSTINFNGFASCWSENSLYESNFSDLTYGTYGSLVTNENNCKELKISMCPAKAKTKLTLKANIYIHLNSTNTLDGSSTGESRVRWLLNPTSEEESPDSYSSCFFYTKLNFVSK